MVQFICDGCGKKMRANDLRYEVSVEVRAARNEIVISLADLIRDHREEMVKLIKQMERSTPDELEAQVYKKIQLDLCPTCQRAYLRDPLRFHPERGGPPPEVDIDAFLRRLGEAEGGD